MARLTPERARVLQTLEGAGGPLSPREIAETLGRTPGSTRELLAQMSRDGVIVSLGRGQFALPSGSTSGGPDVEPDEAPSAPDALDEAPQSPIGKPIGKPDATGMWIYSEADGGHITLAEHRKRKGYPDDSPR